MPAKFNVFAVVLVSAILAPMACLAQGGSGGGGAGGAGGGASGGGIIATGSLGGRRFRAGLRFAAAFGALLVPGRHRLAVLAADTKNAAAVVMAPDSIVVRPRAIAIPKRAPQHSSFLWLGLRSY